jgi:hypothetical protein
MAFATKTIDLAEINKALDVSPADTLVFKERKPAAGKTWFPGVGYLDVKYRLSAQDTPASTVMYGRELTIIVPPSNPADPNSTMNKYKKGNADDNEDNKHKTTIFVSGNSNPTYKNTISKVNAECDRWIKEAEKAGVLKGWVKDNTQFHQMQSTHYSDECPIEEKRGKPYLDSANAEDHRIKIELDFGTYPTDEKTPADKRGKPKTIIKDFSKSKIDEVTGEIEFEIATVDGRPIDETNAYKFLTINSVIEEFYIGFSSISKSKTGISKKQQAQVLVVRSAKAQGTIEKKSNADMINKIKAMTMGAKPSTPPAEPVSTHTPTPADPQASEDAAKKLAEEAEKERLLAETMAKF